MALTKEALKSRAMKLWELRTHRVLANPKNTQNPGNVEVKNAVHEEGCEVAHEESVNEQETKTVVPRRKQRTKAGSL